MTQGEIARRADVSPQVVSRLLAVGNADVTLSVACRLAWAMGKCVSEFEEAVFEEWKMQPKTMEVIDREMATWAAAAEAGRHAKPHRGMGKDTADVRRGRGRAGDAALDEGADRPLEEKGAGAGGTVAATRSGCRQLAETAAAGREDAPLKKRKRSQAKGRGRCCMLRGHRAHRPG